MIFDQIWGIFLVFWILLATISFFKRIHCVRDFHFRGFTEISKSLYEKKRILEVKGFCGKRVEIKLNLKGGIIVP